MIWPQVCSSLTFSSGFFLLGFAFNESKGRVLVYLTPVSLAGAGLSDAGAASSTSLADEEKPMAPDLEEPEICKWEPVPA